MRHDTRSVGVLETEDLTIECSWLSGGGYTRDSAHGPWTIDDPSSTVTGNIYDDNAAPIPYP